MPEANLHRLVAPFPVTHGYQFQEFHNNAGYSLKIALKAFSILLRFRLKRLSGTKSA